MNRLFLIVFMAFMSIMANAQYREVVMPQSPSSPKPYKDYETRVKGFWCGFDLGGGSSIMYGEPNAQYVDLTFTSGYRISEFIRVGAGFGCKMYVHNATVRGTDNKFSVPLFVNARGNFVSAYHKDGVPFWSINIGGQTQEGAFVSPTIGYSFGGLRNNFLIGVNYTLASFKDWSDTKQAYSYFGLKLGYEF